MVNPGLLIEHMGELALLLGLIVVGKWAINMLLGMMFRAGLESSLTIAGTAVPDTNLCWMTVSANGVAAGSTLADLQLRAKTGAQEVALRRDDEIEFAIEADMPLCAGRHTRLGGVGGANRGGVGAAGPRPWMIGMQGAWQGVMQYG